VDNPSFPLRLDINFLVLRAEYQPVIFPFPLCFSREEPEKKPASGDLTSPFLSKKGRVYIPSIHSIYFLMEFKRSLWKTGNSICTSIPKDIIYSAGVDDPRLFEAVFMVDGDGIKFLIRRRENNG